MTSARTADSARSSGRNGTRPQGALAVLIAGAIAVSFSGIFVRLSEVGPSATGFYRFLLALPFLWAWTKIDSRQPPLTAERRHGRDLLLLALAGLFLGLDLAVWHWFIVLTSVSNATLLANIAPIWVALAGWLLLGEQFTRRFLLGLGLGITGVVVLVGGSFSLDQTHVIGDILGLTGGVLWAGYLMVIGGLRGRVSTSAVMFWGTLASCPVLLAIALASGEVLIPQSATGWLYLFGVALVCHVAGQSMIAGTLAHLPASFASVTLLLNPVSATILAWVILNEPAGMQQIVGGAVVLTGIVLSRRDRPDAAANPDRRAN